MHLQSNNTYSVHVFQSKSYSRLWCLRTPISLTVSFYLHSLHTGFINDVLDVVSVLPDDFS